MKINQIQITSATLNLEFSPVAPICVIHGHYSDLALDLVREMIGDCGAIENPNRIDDGQFVIHADIEIDAKNYSVCYIRNADFIGDKRIAANFGHNSIDFSLDDTYEYEHKCREHNINGCNIFDQNNLSDSDTLSENERWIAAFDRFIECLPANDRRPVFLYGIPDRIDESVDITPYLDRLDSLGRQVFIAVFAGQPIDKLNHPLVQTVFISLFEGLSVGDVYDADFTVIRCPVCGNKTLDNHFVCPHCYWEYDYLPEDHYSAANGATLAEYRKEYLESKKDAE